MIYVRAGDRASLILIVLLQFGATAAISDGLNECGRKADLLRRAVDTCEKQMRVTGESSCPISVDFEGHREVTVEEARNLAKDYDGRAANVVWKREAAYYPAACEKSNVIGAPRRITHWRRDREEKIQFPTIAGGITLGCRCFWISLYDDVETLCRRSVSEVAEACGKIEKRISTTTVTLHDRQAILVGPNPEITDGPPTGHGCGCKPPGDGVEDR